MPNPFKGRLVTGKPSGVVVTIGDFSFEIITPTFEEFDTFVKSVIPFAVEAERGNLASIQKLNVQIREVLRKSARATGSITNDEENEIFEEWFAALPLEVSLRAITDVINGVTKAGTRALPAHKLHDIKDILNRQRHGR
jgi:hypothetical protein